MRDLPVEHRADNSQHFTYLRNALEVVGGGNGTAAAAVHQSDSFALDFSHESVLGDANVRALHDQAIAIVGDLWNEIQESKTT